MGVSTTSELSDDAARHLVRSILAQGLDATVRAGGLSMGAVFREVRDVTLRSPDRARWGAGSIVVYERDGRWIAHRVIWRFGQVTAGESVCVTKGDGQRHVDRPFVKEEELVGVVVATHGAKGNESLLSGKAMLEGWGKVATGVVVCGFARLRFWSRRRGEADGKAGERTTGG